ncbi:MAG: TonB-dependent receptor [Crocinitomicaceae bacterium]|nr:TonB-dependent receptor [Crocinitomicaceae bacterium]
MDKFNRKHIPNAKIECKDLSVRKVADLDGRFNLKDFYSCDSISVSYSSYSTGYFLVADLKNVVVVELSDVKLDIDGIDVTANRWKQEKAEVPGRITQLKIKDIDLYSPQTTADLLESSGYVFVQKSQLAGGSPQLRGFGTNRIMIVVDGVRMNNAIFRSGNLQNVLSIDPNSLEDAEILFGPGSVMYGSDAIGGVMDFTTKEAKFSTDSVRRFVKTNIFSRYSSASNEFSSHVDFSFGTRKFASTTALSYSSFGDLIAGKYGNDHFLRPTYQENGLTVQNPNPRKQVHTGYDQINAIQKFSFQANEHLRIDYGFIFSTNLKDAPRYDRLTLDDDNDGNLDYQEWYYGPQEWMMNRLALTADKKTKMYDEFRTVMAYQKFKESRNDRKFGSSDIRRQFEEVDALSLNIDLHKLFGKRTTLFYGTEAIYNKVGSKAFREDDDTTTVINPRYPNGSTWQAYGVYASLKYLLTDDWILNTGMRYSHYYIQADFDTSLFPYPITSTVNSNGSLNGSLGLVYHPNKTSQYYFNASTGFRAPNIDDLGKVFDSEPGSVVIPNENLKAEHAYNTEIGFVKSFKAKWKIDAAIYYTYLQNALSRADYTLNGQDSILYEGTLSQVQAIQNTGNAHVYGIQGGFEISLAKGLSLFSSISYQKGQELDIDSAVYYPKSHVAPLFGRTALRYKRRQLSLEFYSVYHAKVSHDDLPLNERNGASYARDENGLAFTPAWYTLNFKASIFFNKHMALNAGIENITNQLYRSLGSGLSAPGLNFIISLKATF